MNQESNVLKDGGCVDPLSTASFGHVSPGNVSSWHHSIANLLSSANQPVNDIAPIIDWSNFIRPGSSTTALAEHCIATELPTTTEVSTCFSGTSRAQGTRGGRGGRRARGTRKNSLSEKQSLDSISSIFMNDLNLPNENNLTNGQGLSYNIDTRTTSDTLTTDTPILNTSISNTSILNTSIFNTSIPNTSIPNTAIPDPSQCPASFMSAMASFVENMSASGNPIPNATGNPSFPQSLLVPGLEQTFFERFPWLLEQLSQSALDNGMYGFGAAIPFTPAALTSWSATPNATEELPIDENDASQEINDTLITDDSTKFTEQKKVSGKSVEAVIAKLRQNCGQTVDVNDNTLTQSDQYTIRDILERNDEFNRQTPTLSDNGPDQSKDYNASAFSQENDRQSISRRTSFNTDDRDSDCPHDSIVKRRRKPEEPEEYFIRLPLTMGWQRKTHVRLITKTGVRGDVVYFSPDSRKLKSFQEIDRYLLRCEFNNLTRQNFTFSSKLLVGTFVQHHRDQFDKIVSDEVSEDEIVQQIKQINPEFQRQQPCGSQKFESSSNQDIPKKARLHSSSRRRLPSTINSKGIRVNQTEAQTLGITDPSISGDALHNVNNTCSMDKLDRKISDSQDSSIPNINDIITSTAMNQVNSLPFFAESLLNYQSLINNQSNDNKSVNSFPGLYSMACSISNQLNANPITTFANLPEDSKIQAMNNEKTHAAYLIAKQRRQKLIDISIAKELKSNVEDLLIRDSKSLPELTPVSDICVSQQAFADCLGVVEFLSSFAYTLQIGRTLIPDILELQRSLWNTDNDASNSCFYFVLKFLLQTALSDNGTPNGKKAILLLGQKHTEFELNPFTISEMLRLYIYDRMGDDEMTNALAFSSVFNLDPNMKASILSFLCNELLCSRMITECIDCNLSQLVTLRHRKWEVEGLIRKLRLEQGKADVDHVRDDTSSLTTATDANEQIVGQIIEKDECQFEQIVSDGQANEQLNEIDPLLTTVLYSEEEDEISDNECLINSSEVLNSFEVDSNTKLVNEDEAQITELLGECELIKKTVNQRTGLMRCSQLGQDRYFRRYWLFSRIGAIYVEGGHDDRELAVQSGSETLPSSINIELSDEEVQDFIESGDEDDDDHKNSEEIHLPINVLSQLSIGKRTERILNINLPIDLSMKRRVRAWIFSVPCLLQSFSEDKHRFINCESNLSDNAGGKGIPIIPPKERIHTDIAITEDEATKLAQQKLQFDHPQPVPLEMQHGWWCITDMSVVRELLLSLSKRGIREKNLYRSITRNIDQIDFAFCRHTIPDDDDKPDGFTIDIALSVNEESVNSPRESTDSAKKSTDQFANIALLENLYTLEDRVIAANLQARGTTTEAKQLFNKDMSSDDEINVTKRRLAFLERIIERRYFKQPFVRKMETSKLGSTGTDEDQTIHMERWRRAVQDANNASQLSLCLIQLDKHIAWEKSIMRVICQICNKDENEDRLLLCDGCDRGHHTYCFKPQITMIPEGDWFCLCCISKSQNKPICFICGNHPNVLGVGKSNLLPLLSCERCQKLFHAECHTGAYITRNKCVCLVCHATNKLSSKRSRIDGRLLVPSSAIQPNLASPPSSPELKKTMGRLSCTFPEKVPSSAVETKECNSIILPAINAKKRRTRTQSIDDKNTLFQQKCRDLTAELFKQPASWPFRQPVDVMLYPEYYRVIKHPIDLQAIRKKARLNQYSTKDDFAADVSKIFENCHFFNEDDSSIGQAGMEMRRYFETRYSEVFLSD